MNIIIDKNLFLAYCGLIASGYDLMDTSDPLVREVCRAAEQARLEKRLLDYFSYTRTGTISVNPYYPRGSELSSACFFLEKPLSDFLEFLRSCNAPEAEDPEFRAWIARLPGVIKTLADDPILSAAWELYSCELAQRFSGLSPQILALQQRLDDLHWGNGVRILFAPNLLQSKYLADFSLADSRLYLIAGEFSESAAIHEYLHPLLQKQRGAVLRLLRVHGLDRFLNTEKVAALGYLIGISEEDQAHALEECIVRAITGVLSGVSPEEYCKMNLEYGFTSLPEMMERLWQNSLEKKTLEEILSDVISPCLTIDR